jgi:phage terminase small subunit
MTPAQRELFKKLTPFQKRLAPALMSGLKSLEAYRLAQPTVKNTAASARVIVNRTINNKKFVAYMDAMNDDIVSEAIMEREEALERLSLLARGSFASMVDFKTIRVGLDDDGDEVLQSVWKIKDSALQDPKQLAAIAELSASAQGLKMKMHSPAQAIMQLTAMQGWAKPAKVDHSSKDGSMTPKPTILAFDPSKLSDGALNELLNAYESTDSD